MNPEYNAIKHNSILTTISIMIISQMKIILLRGWERSGDWEVLSYVLKKRKESDVTYSQVWWPILGICALHLTHPTCTHTAVNTHTVNTHMEQWAAIYAAEPGEQLGVRCLAQGSHLSRGIEGGESAGYSLPPTYNPCRLETRTRGLWVTSPTLTIRPWLPICVSLLRLLATIVYFVSILIS